MGHHIPEEDHPTPADPSETTDVGAITLPTIGNYLRLIREKLGLSRDGLARLVNLSVAYIEQIETNRRNPSVHALQAFAAALKLDASQRRFAFDLLEPPTEIAPIEELRDYLTESDAHQERLAALEPHPAAFFAPNWHLVAANNSYRQLFPGLDGSTLTWHFLRPESKQVLLDWKHEALENLRWAKYMFGHYRSALWAEELLTDLSTDNTFRKLWRTDDNIVFGRGDECYMHLRDQHTGEPLTLNVQTGTCAERYTLLSFIGIRLPYNGPQDLL